MTADEVAQQGARHSGQAAERGDGDGVPGPGAVVKQGDGNAHPLGDVVQADGDGGQHAGEADAGGGHSGAHRHAHGHVVHGHRGSQHNAGGVQIVMAAGAAVVVQTVVVVGASVDPAVEQKGEAESHHQEDRGEVIVAGGLHGLGDHVEGDDAQHQPRREGQQQASGLGGFPLEQGGQTAPQRQTAHPGDQGEQDDKTQDLCHRKTPC